MKKKKPIPRYIEPVKTVLKKLDILVAKKQEREKHQQAMKENFVKHPVQE